MGYQFTIEELQEVIRASRVYNPGFSDRQLQDLLKMKGRLTEAGYLEAVNGLAQLEKEGAPTTRTLEEHKALIRRNAELENKLSKSQTKLQNLEENKSQAEVELSQIQEAIQQTNTELAEIRASRDRENRELAEFRMAAAKEKEKLAQEVEECRQQARVTQEETVTAGQLKAEIETQGYNLDLLLSLAKEFGNHPDACKKLVEDIKKYQTVGECITALEKQYREQYQILQAEREKGLIDVKRLKADRFNLENILSKLQADKAYEDDVHHFYRRYWKVSRLLDCLASWDKVYFYRCHNPISAMGGFFNPEVKNAYFWTDKEVMVCPHCGFKLFHYDEKPYQDLGVLPGIPVKVELGE